MRIGATVASSMGGLEVAVRTGESTRPLSIASKAGGAGSSVNAGAFLMIALATCCCNDLHGGTPRLLRETDAVAEVHNAVRSGAAVRLVEPAA